MNTEASKSALDREKAAAGESITGLLRDGRDDVTVRAGLLGSSVRVVALLSRLRKLARSTLPVLIVGERGAGKSNVARAIHLNSPRSERPMISQACATLREPFLMGQLFGHVRGAFTGASSSRDGLFDELEGGTLHLDEVADLTPTAQAALCGVLETGEFRRIGSSAVQRVDFRLITSTSCDLEVLASHGLFRPDLLDRIRGAVIEVPPLRERHPDLMDLASRVAKEEAGRLRRPEPTFSPDAVNALLAYPWPGNVRELVQEIRQAVALSDGPEVTPSAFRFVHGISRVGVPRRPPTSAPIRERLERVEADAIRDAMQLSRGNKADAARRLGLTRRTLYRRLCGLSDAASARGTPANPDS